MRRCQDSTAPQYLTAHWAPVSETASRQHLHSAASHQLTVPLHRLITHGGRAFAVAAPSTWNSLPKRLRNPSNSTSVFGRLLKAFSSHSTKISSTLEALARMRYIHWHFYHAMLCICSTSHGPVSVTSQCSTKTAKRRITQKTPHDSRGTRFLVPKIFAKFDRGHPLRGRRMQVGWVKIGDFWPIASYISKTVRDRHIVLLKSNRKSYALYRMVTLPMTLSAP